MNKKILENLDNALTYFLEKKDFEVVKKYLDQILLMPEFEFEKKNEYVIQYYLETNQFRECIKYAENLFLLDGSICYVLDSILYAVWKSYYEKKEYKKAYIAMYLSFHVTKKMDIKKEIKQMLKSPCFKSYYHPMAVLDAPPDFLAEKFLMVNSEYNSEIIKVSFEELDFEKAWNDINSTAVDLFDDILMRILFADKPRYIICGLSYMEGFFKNIYELETLNCSLASQDIYYNYLVLKYILEILKKPELIDTCIMNLAYYSFDFDLSRRLERVRISSYMAILEDTHHYDALKSLYVRNEVMHQKMTMLEKFNYRMERIDVKEEESDDTLNAIIKVHTKMNYTETRKENYQWFTRSLMLLSEHHIKPVILITPVTKKYAKKFETGVVKRFYAAIEEIQKSYPFKIVDLFQSDIFSDEDFRDSSHLNTDGYDKLKKTLEVEVL